MALLFTIDENGGFNMNLVTYTTFKGNVTTSYAQALAEGIKKRTYEPVIQSCKVVRGMEDKRIKLR